MIRWILVVVLLAGMLGAYGWLSSTPTEPQRVEAVKAPGSPPPGKATLTPGRVVELHTKRGEIDFVLFEKDCPRTAKRIADLVAGGSYNNVKFERVEPGKLIQCGSAKARVSAMGRELLRGLTHAKGAVGMARTNDPNSATSVFYILMEPMPHLDYEYTVFGRVIRGMDVVMATAKGDKILSARVRPLTPGDRKLFSKALQLEVERRVN